MSSIVVFSECTATARKGSATFSGRLVTGPGSEFITTVPVANIRAVVYSRDRTTVTVNGGEINYPCSRDAYEAFTRSLWSSD